MKIREDFVSNEEYHFYHWLKEAESHNLVTNIKYQPGKYPLSCRVSVPVEKKLKTKTKIVDKFLFHPHYYSPDFSFCPSKKLSPFFISTMFVGAAKQVIVDVKGTFNQYNDQKQFVINQKWVYQKYGIYIEKIVPERFFKKTWCPDICRFSPKKKQPVKKYIGVPTVLEFIEAQRNAKK